MACGIYLLVSPSGDRYVGSSKRIERRYREHKRDSLRGCHVNPNLSRSFLKHGDLRLDILEECLPELLIQREQFYIDSLQPEMNISRIAGRIDFTSETIAKISKGWTLERRAETSQRMMGNKLCLGRKDGPETQEKRSKAMKGHTFSEASKKKMSESHTIRMAKRKENGYGRYNPR